MNAIPWEWRVFIAWLIVPFIAVGLWSGACYLYDWISDFRWRRRLYKRLRRR